MSIMAIGPLAETCRSLEPGVSLRVAGHLNQRRWIRDGVTRWGRMELVARKIQRLDDASAEKQTDGG